MTVMAKDSTVTSVKKRTADEAGIIGNTTAPVTTKRRAMRKVHHALHHQQEIEADSLLNCRTQEASQAMLERSIAMALDTVGFDYAETAALAGFRVRVEEYMEHFLRDVRASMTAGLRRSPVPHDFVHALGRHNLTLNSLTPHLDPPVEDPTTQRHPILNSKREIMPKVEVEHEDPSKVDEPAEMSTLGAILNDNTKEARAELIPCGFPVLPSRHTYKAHAVLPPREADPQKIREKATEEGRLGEEALRRFTAKVAEIKAAKMKITAEPQQQQRPESFVQRAGDMWKNLMDNLAVPQTNGHIGGGFEATGLRSTPGGAKELLSGPVNADSRYWRKLPKRLAEKT